MSNLLEAIVNISKAHTLTLPAIVGATRNRANAVGEQMEIFVKDAFAGTIGVAEGPPKMRAYANCFSWLGSPNNPPDAMIRQGDAIEIKKLETAVHQIQLNSSYPKDKLRADSSMITSACREAERWVEKDLIVAVGHVEHGLIRALDLVYGDLYAADHSVYDQIKLRIERGINEIPGISLDATNELARINRVDPLGRTSLRVRGMWLLDVPRISFAQCYPTPPAGTEFQLYCLVRTTKLQSMPLGNQKSLATISGLSIDNIQVQDPNNGAKLIHCTRIIYRRSRQ